MVHLAVSTLDFQCCVHASCGGQFPTVTARERIDHIGSWMETSG